MCTKMISKVLWLAYMKTSTNFHVVAGQHIKNNNKNTVYDIQEEPQTNRLQSKCLRFPQGTVKSLKMVEKRRRRVFLLHGIFSILLQF